MGQTITTNLAWRANHVKIKLLFCSIILVSFMCSSYFGGERSEMSKFLYFAYGSNLLAKRIHLNNPSATRKGFGKLRNYRLDFVTYSSRWKGASATIVPTPGHHVWGAIWELDIVDKESLDNQEGVHQALYFPLTVDVETEDGDVYKCRVYQQTVTPKALREGESLPLDRRPSELYRKIIIDGAKETGLPEDYVEKIVEIPSVPVKGDLNLALQLKE